MENITPQENNLTPNKTDLAVTISKTVLGIIPYAGNFIGEIIGNIIPNQRIDRIAKFCTELDKEIKELPIEIIKSLQKNEEFVDFLEESFLQASRAFSEERRTYILKIVINGIKDENLEIIQSKHLLKILNELNDIEIIWLRYHHNYYDSRDKEFEEQHKNILEKVYAYVKCDDETLIKAAIQDSYLEHLERLELLNTKIKIDKQSNQPRYNKATGQPETSHTRITTLGKLLLKQIGLIEELQSYNSSIF